MNIKTYVLTIRPESAFGTPLKGDTLFGQFCWMVAEDPSLARYDLSTLLAPYEKNPFVVFSSAWPVVVQDEGWVFALPRPELPMSVIGDGSGTYKGCAERLKARKDRKAKKWFLVGEALKEKLSWERLVNDRELFDIILGFMSEAERADMIQAETKKAVERVVQQHNTINRQTMTTGTGMFAPYEVHNMWFLPGMELSIFVALDEDLIDIEGVQRGLERIGEFGFGRDASTGLGRFSVGEIEEIEWPGLMHGEPVFTLGPSVPEQNRFKKAYFQPFTRFGRHGAQLIHMGNPFKRPVVMADEGAVFFPGDDDRIETPWIGTGVKGVSRTMKETVCQGYSLVLPLKLDVPGAQI